MNNIFTGAANFSAANVTNGIKTKAKKWKLDGAKYRLAN